MRCSDEPCGVPLRRNMASVDPQRPIGAAGTRRAPWTRWEGHVPPVPAPSLGYATGIYHAMFKISARCIPRLLTLQRKGKLERRLSGVFGPLSNI